MGCSSSRHNCGRHRRWRRCCQLWRCLRRNGGHAQRWWTRACQVERRRRGCHHGRPNHASLRRCRLRCLLLLPLPCCCQRCCRGRGHEGCSLVGCHRRKCCRCARCTRQVRPCRRDLRRCCSSCSCEWGHRWCWRLHCRLCCHGGLLINCLSSWRDGRHAIGWCGWHCHCSCLHGVALCTGCSEKVLVTLCRALADQSSRVWRALPC